MEAGGGQEGQQHRGREAQVRPAGRGSQRLIQPIAHNIYNTWLY